MAGIRVKTSAKRIEVNDNGEYIVLDFGDNSFPDRFFAMVDRVQEQANAATSEAEEIDDRYEKGSEEHMRASAALWRKIHENIMDEIDSLFGVGTCKKVFGDIVPGIELYDDFFTQLIPYFNEAGQERARRMSKYSASRVGNV